MKAHAVETAIVAARFTVRLPIKALRPGEARPSPAPLATQEPEAAGWTPSLEGLCILVVDDGDEAREMVAAILEKRGARVTALPSAHETLAALAEHKPDVLLLDLELADADGDSLIQKIRALPAVEGSYPVRGPRRIGRMTAPAPCSPDSASVGQSLRPAYLLARWRLTGRTRQPAEAQEAQA